MSWPPPFEPTRLTDARHPRIDWIEHSWTSLRSSRPFLKHSMQSTDQLHGLASMRDRSNSWLEQDAASALKAPAFAERRVVPRFRQWLARPAARWTIIAVSLLCCAPAISSGFLLDDSFHAIALRGDEVSAGTKRAPWDAFAFAKNPASLKQMIDEGVFPWWSDLQARMSFLRPLTSLTLWLDHQLWHTSPTMMHIHSLLWYALLLVVVSLVYRRFSISPAFVALALAAYALDDARAMTVGWIANRGALLALACGFGALLAHDSWRRTGGRRFLALSLGLMATGLLCAEAAVQALGYVVAYALFIDTGTKRERVASLVPHVILLVAWRSMYVALGYGASRTAVYIDPGADPLRFLQAVATRLPILFGAQFSGLSADLGDVLKYVAPGLLPWLLPLTVACTGILVWLFLPLWKASRQVRFWATGTLLSTIPICAAVPADRLLVATALGASALVAMLVLAVVDRAEVIRDRARVHMARLVAVINLVVAPVLLPVQCSALAYLGRYIDAAETSVPSGPEIADKTVVLVNPPSDEYGIYLPFHRQVHGRTMPKHIRWLATADNDLEITRVDRHTLKVRPRRGFLPPGSLWTLRTPETRSFVGETLELTGVTYVFTEVSPDGRPAEVLVRFAAPLDSEEFVWMRWGDKGGFEPFALPEPGNSTLLAAVDLGSVLDTL
jgi:hypothetical protein